MVTIDDSFTLLQLTVQACIAQGGLIAKLSEFCRRDPVQAYLFHFRSTLLLVQQGAQRGT